jgi:hypothetical protein
MAKAFIMRRDSVLEPRAKKGTTVYECSRFDYGIARDDYFGSGVPHLSVTLDPNGDYPFFTVPMRDLEAVGAPKRRRGKYDYA